MTTMLAPRPVAAPPMAASVPPLDDARRPVAAPGEWRAPLLVLGAILALLCLAFAEEGAAAIQVWETSTAYNHCWLILPIAGWLAWTRRGRLVELRPAPNPWFALLAVPPALAWLAAERLGIMEGRQLAALALLEVAVLAVLGWRFVRAFIAPLAYLVFLVPFGAFTVPALQRITAALIELGLTAFGVPHYIDDLLIEIPAGSFLVAEACAGLRFLIAALAFGALYAAVMFRSLGRRLLVMVLALLVPILANGMRAFGIVMTGHWLGSAEAAAADHVIYGWVFFSIVILLLILAGLPFREDLNGPAPLPPAPPGGPSPRRRLVAAGVLAGLIALAGPGMAFTLQGSGTAVETPVQLATIPGCVQAADGLSLDCDGTRLAARLVVFPARSSWDGIAAETRRAFGTADDDIAFSMALPGSVTWRGRQSRTAPGTAAAAAAWLDGQPAGGGLRSRLEQGWRSLHAESGAPVLAVVSLQPPPGGGGGRAAERDLLRQVLEAQAVTIAARAAARSAGG
jgi:exosortase A